MPYNVQKLIEILEILAKNGQELTKLRITKLLYLIDKYHLRRFGRSVLNDRYYRLQFGPVPSLTLNIIDNFLCPIKFPGIKRFDEPFDEFFDRAKDRRGFDKLKLKKEKEKSVWLSESEIEAINYVLSKVGSSTTSRLVDICHKEKTCQATPENSPIKYELFLDGLPEDRKRVIMGLLKIEEESAQVVSELSR